MWIPSSCARFLLSVWKNRARERVFCWTRKECRLPATIARSVLFLPNNRVDRLFARIGAKKVWRNDTQPKRIRLPQRSFRSLSRRGDHSKNIPATQQQHQSANFRNSWIVLFHQLVLGNNCTGTNLVWDSQFIGISILLDSTCTECTISCACLVVLECMVFCT